MSEEGPAQKEVLMPGKRASVKNEKQYGSGGSSKQGGTTAQKKAAGRKGGKAAASKS
jgi:hypothetical protein